MPQATFLGFAAESLASATVRVDEEEAPQSAAAQLFCGGGSSEFLVHIMTHNETDAEEGACPSPIASIVTVVAVLLTLLEVSSRGCEARGRRSIFYFIGAMTRYATAQIP